MKEIKKLNKLLFLFSVIFLSCKSTTHVSLSSIYIIENKKTSEYVLYNTSTVLPLITITKDEKVACINNKIVYVQCNNKEHILKYKIKKIVQDDILVEVGVGYYVKLADDWYGFLADINDDISNSNFEIKYIFKKDKFSCIGNIKGLISYNDYLIWLNKSMSIKEDPINTIVIME